MDDLATRDLVGVADAIARREVSAREVTRWSLQRLETTGRRLNAVFRIDHEEAMARAAELDELQARKGVCGPLHGVPLAHKDLFQVAGRECHCGSILLRGRKAERTSHALAQLDAAGQVNTGSLHMAEFALSPTGFNGHYGPALNPWHPEHVCGGSSSGSGVAVAARLVFGSLGSDTAGSIRMPAAMCGVTGLKTTFRRISAEGCVPLSASLDSMGPIAQTARDCARLLTHASGPNAADGLCTRVPHQDYEAALDGRLQGVRIGVPEAYFRSELDPAVEAALDASLEVLRRLGAAIVTAEVPDMERVNALARVLMTVEAATLHRRWIREQPGAYSTQVRVRIEEGFAYPAVRYAEALSLRRRIADDFLRTAFAGCDLLHVPVLTLQVPTIRATTEGEPATVLRTIARITYAARGVNYLGLPAISVPAGLSAAGLPLAFQLIGKPFAEAALLRVADAYQRATEWHRRMPPAAMPA